jgi:cyclopropane fatty-acyl-phospholipid synthase-like methyltransferase
MGIIAGKNCPLCGSTGTPIAGSRLRLCCGILLSWEWDSEEAYHNQYVTNYHTEIQKQEGQKPFTECLDMHYEAGKSRISTIFNLFPYDHGTLCDIGTGSGGFLEAVEDSLDHILYAVGIEPNQEMVDWCESRGLEVSVGGWQHVSGCYDFITLFDVFEHLTRPAEVLAYLKKCLTARGRLIIEMPEWDSPMQREAGLNWKHIRPKQHLTLYSRRAFDTLLERHGFELVAFYRPLNGALGKATWVARSL